MALRYPRPPRGDEPITMRQLREWGKEVVDELLRTRIHGDGRRVKVFRDRGGTTVGFMEDPEVNLAFLGYWARGQRFGASGDTLAVRAGVARWLSYTSGVATQQITAPSAGTATKFYYVECALTTTGVTATWSNGASYPALVNGTTVNWPIGRLVERDTAGTWDWYQDHVGDICIAIPICLVLKTLTSYDSSKTQVPGHASGTCQWFDVSECTTTTTTTTTA